MGDEQAKYRFPLAGLQAGVLGVLVMVAWLALASVATGRSAWLPANLFAMLFHGPKAYRNFYHRDAWSGLAFLIVAYGLAGAAWGQLLAVFVRTERSGFLRLYGVLAGLIVYTVVFGMLVKARAPLIGIYAPDLPMRVGHILWGLALAKTPQYAYQMAKQEAQHYQPPAGFDSV